MGDQRSALRKHVEQNALSLVFGLLFVGSLVGHAWAGRSPRPGCRTPRCQGLRPPTARSLQGSPSDTVSLPTAQVRFLRAVQQPAARRRTRQDQPGRVPDLCGLRCRRRRELAKRVPPVRALHRHRHVGSSETLAGYLANADFWSRTLQNWQSEFLAVGSMAIFSVFLRQRGSSQSKPVGEPHATTGAEG
jgi:hypothetical protein